MKATRKDNGKKDHSGRVKEKRGRREDMMKKGRGWKRQKDRWVEADEKWRRRGGKREG